MTNNLASHLAELAQTLAQVRLPLPLPSAATESRTATEIQDQLRDYLLPRLENLDAPLLAVIGGSTGSGKSTLINSIIGAPVSPPGVIRPTTKAPVLVCHPNDATWFQTGRVLPGLIRTHADTIDSRALKIVTTEVAAPGLAILDAPDIDSIDVGNRELANQLLQAADLWLFVTTAARYADAVPWSFLAGAASRSAALAVVLDRVPAEAIPDVPNHLTRLMAERGLAAAPLFVVPEAELTESGFLPEPEIGPIRDWLHNLASAAETRKRIVWQTLSGAISALPPRIQSVSAAVLDQAEAVTQLTADTRQQFATAAKTITAGAADGSLLRGEVLSSWQDFVGTGEFMRTVEQKIGWLRDRVVGILRGAPPEAEKVQGAVSAELEALIFDQLNLACSGTFESWMGQPAGRFLLTNHADLARPQAKDVAVQRLVRDWQGDIYRLVESQGLDRRAKARFLALGVNGLGAALIVVIFASTSGLTGAEVGVAGGTAVLAQRLLEAVFGDGAVRKLAEQAKQQLAVRVQELLDAEESRFLDLLAGLTEEDLGDRLSELATELAKADFDG